VFTMITQASNLSSADKTSIVLRYANKLGFSSEDNIILKALRLVRDKGVAVSHVIAELLLCKYLMEKGYECEIEYTHNNVKCDVYARKRSIDECIEILYYAVPLDNIENWTNYIVLTHLRKAMQILKSSIYFVSFAYPVGLIPLIPPTFFEIISGDRLAKVMASYGLHEPEVLERVKDTPIIHHIYVFDLSKAKVCKISYEEAKMLILLYNSLTDP